MLLKRPAHKIKEPICQENWVILHDDVRESVWVKIKGTQKHVIRRFWDEDFDYSSWEVWISDDVTNSAWGIMEESDPKYIKEI